MKKTFLLLILTAALFQARAQTAITTETITVTNLWGTTNGNTIVIDGSTRTFTNLFLWPSSQVQMGTNPAFASSNLFLDFAEAPISGAHARWDKTNTVTLQSFPGSSLTVSIGAGWGTLATSVTTIGVPLTVLRLPINGVGSYERTQMENFVVALLNDTAATTTISPTAPMFANFSTIGLLIPGFGLETNITGAGTIMSVDTNQLANLVDALIPAYIGGEQYPWGMIPNMTWTNVPYGTAWATGSFISGFTGTNAWGAFSTNQQSTGLDFNGGMNNTVTYAFPASVTVSNFIFGCLTPLNNSVQVTLKGSPDGITWTSLGAGYETNLNNYPINITNTFAAFTGKYFEWIITNSDAGIEMGGSADWTDEGQQIGPVPNLQLGGANSTIVITGLTAAEATNIVDNEGSTKFLPQGDLIQLDTTNLTVFGESFLNDSNLDVYWTPPSTNFQGGSYPWGLIPSMTWSNAPSGFAYLTGAGPNTTNAWAAFTTETTSANLQFNPPSTGAVLGYSFSSPHVVYGDSIVFNDFEQNRYLYQFQYSSDGVNWANLASSTGFAGWGNGGDGVTNFFQPVNAQYFRWLITNASPDFELGDGVQAPIAQIYGVPQYPSPINSGVNYVASPSYITLVASNGVAINGPQALGFDLTVPALSAQSASMGSLNIGGLSFNGYPVNLSSLINFPATVIGTNFAGIATNFNGPFTWDGYSNYYTNNFSGWELVPGWNTNLFSGLLPSNSWLAVTNLSTFATNFGAAQVFSPFNPNYGTVPNGMYPYYLGSLIGNWEPGRYWVPSAIGSSTLVGFTSPYGTNGILPYTISGPVPSIGLTTNITLSGGATLYITNGMLQAYH